MYETSPPDEMAYGDYVCARDYLRASTVVLPRHCNVLEVLVVTKIAPLSGLDPASA